MNDLIDANEPQRPRRPSAPNAGTATPAIKSRTRAMRSRVPCPRVDTRMISGNTGSTSRNVPFIATAAAASTPARSAFRRVLSNSTMTRNASKLRKADGISGSAIRLCASMFVSKPSIATPSPSANMRTCCRMARQTVSSIRMPLIAEKALASAKPTPNCPEHRVVHSLIGWTEKEMQTSDIPFAGSSEQGAIARCLVPSTLVRDVSDPSGIGRVRIQIDGRALRTRKPALSRLPNTRDAPSREIAFLILNVRRARRSRFEIASGNPTSLTGGRGAAKPHGSPDGPIPYWCASLPTCCGRRWSSGNSAAGPGQQPHDPRRVRRQLFPAKPSNGLARTRQTAEVGARLEKGRGSAWPAVEIVVNLPCALQILELLESGKGAELVGSRSTFRCTRTAAAALQRRAAHPIGSRSPGALRESCRTTRGSCDCRRLTDRR